MQEREQDQQPGIDPEADDRRAAATAQWERAAPRAPWHRRRVVQIAGATAVVAVVAVGVQLTVGGRAGTSGTAAVSSPTADAVSSAASTSDGPMVCTLADHPIAPGFTAWKTLMTAGHDWAAWLDATRGYETGVSAVVGLDQSAGEQVNADAAQALDSALLQVEADLATGQQTGLAPGSYVSDSQAVIAAESPFEACSAQ